MEDLKFQIFAEGIGISDAATGYLRTVNGPGSLTPADYASTSGLILKLDGDVWVNAPEAEHNPNFVSDDPSVVLDADADGLVVRHADGEARAAFWPPPSYHGRLGSNGKPYNYYAFTHGDRVRISPMQGCGMVCKFCNIPYEDPYGTKPLAAIHEAIDVALEDPVQPARHILISGGTPKPQDFGFLQGAYRSVLTRYPDIDIDIMMVPVDGLLDIDELSDLGVRDLSINIEIVNQQMARSYMRQKLQHGLDHYLAFIEQASKRLGPGRVRSMLMVGLEPAADTLEGVRRILDSGGVPVLSPFRPAPSTPLANLAPPDAAMLELVFTEAATLAEEAGVSLGPDCPPCTHNTLTLLGSDPEYRYAHPEVR